MVEKDSFDHVVKTTAQWESQSFEYWIIPRGVLCVELTPDKKTKIKIGEGNKIYSQLPYINSETDLSDYYTKEEIDNILAMLNFVAIPSSEIYPTKEALPQTGNRQGDLRFVLNTTGDPYEYLWFDNKWISLGGDLSEYAKKSEVNPRLNALELKAHTHVNKNVLDRLTANVIDDSHKHTNKNILDATTASYTTQDKATLDELAAITIFEGATKTEDGTMGYVPAPLQGQHTYFLKGDGTWAYLDPGDKYKAGEGIYILSGEVTAQTFPFKLYAKGGYVKQYIIYGAPGGVGEWNATTQTYHIPIRVSAEGHTSLDTVIQVRDKLYEGDWINFETQEYSVYRTNLTSQFQNLMAINEMSGIDTAGNFNKPPGYWPQFALSDYYEIDPDAKYEIPELDDWSYTYANVNMYDADKNRTRTILRSRTSKVQIIPLLGEKYIRIAGWVDINFSTNLHTFRDPVIYQLKDTISPVPSPLQQIQLIPNAINTIDVLTTTKPLDVYMETYIPEEPDPEDPLSGYSGIIYNDGVLDVTQEDPNALNELTVHFRENVEKTLTIPTYELPIASDTTLGGIKVGANLTIDEDGVLDAITKSGDKYKAGEGITILSGEVISDTFPFEIFPKAATVTQYVIYGTASGVGNLVSGHYEVPIKVSAPGHTDIIQTISLSDPLYDGDYIDYQRQVFVHYRTEVTNQITTDPSYAYKKAIYSDGVIRELDPGAYGDIPRVSRVYELMSGATYELTPWNVNGYSDFNRFRVGQYLNIYDADMNITRTLYQEHLGNTIIIVGENEKYMRMTVRQWGNGNVLTYQHLYQLYPIETPCVLQALTLHPGVVNTVDVLTTNKPNEIYVEVVPPDDEDIDPDDPMSEYTGIIYNDGVLDVTQEDPNALNELTVHFRDNVDKTITIPSTPLPIATDSTLGGIIVGDNLTIDENGVLDATGGDKYRAGEGIYILSGEIIADTFPFEIFPKTSRTSQYIIYGSEAGVGDWDGTNYTLSITTSAPGETTLTTQILYNAQLYSGDYVDYSRQIIHHSKQDMRQYISLYNHSTYGTRGTFQTNTGSVIGNYNSYTGVTNYIEVNPGEVYLIKAFVPYGPYDGYFDTFHCIFDENHALTRYFSVRNVGVVTIEIQPGEKYARFVGTPSDQMLQPGFVYKLEAYEEPCVLPSILLYANKVNTINVSNTNKPSEIYFEAASDGTIDPEDPTSEFTGIIYNEGVLDVTQEDPTALNELTFHFRDNVDKTLTIPSEPLPIASDTTLGGIKVGNNLAIDPVTGVLDATGGNSYVEGQGIEFSRPILETYQVLDKIRKPSGTTLTTDVMPSGTVDFFCDLKYYKYAGDSFLILCYDGERGSFCYTPAPTASGGWARMWIYTAHQNWYDLYLNGSFASSSPIVAHLRWGNTMSMSFDHTSTSAQNTPGVLPGHNRFKFDTSSDADLYWAKFYENSALVGELVPVIRQSDNVVGLFNKVTETFSTVSGLTAGTPTGETIVIYDQSSTQNIPINAKLGRGLQFDSNDAIEVVPATASTLGGIIVGDGLSVDNTGEISVDEMTGADGTNAGTAGIVPAPGAADNTKFLRGDGTWVEVSGSGSDYVEGNGIEFIPSSITPTGYQTVEYIQSTGTQAIILGYTPSSQNVKIKLTFSDINNSASGWHYMYGGWDTDSIRPPSVAYQQNGSNLVVAIGNGLAIQNGEYPSTSGVHTSTLITLNGNYVSLQLDAGTISSSSFGGSIYRPMALFAQTNSSGTTVAEFGSYKFHEMEIYEDDILIHHYYPCYRLSDDEIGIYDIIENVFLTNSGTGTFIRSNTPVYIDGPDSINAKLGNGLQFDANGAIETIAATEYAAGDGIQIDEGTSVIDITNIQWQQGKIDDSDGSEAITGVEPYLDCEMFEITSHTSMVTLSGTYDNNIMLLWKPYYYDENDDYISTVNTWSTYEDGVQIPINAKYVRFVLTKDETTTLDPNDLAHVEIEYPLEVGKDVITNTGVIDIQVRDRKLIITKHNSIEEIPIPDPPLATTSTPGIVVVGEDLDIDENGVLNIADINRLILNAEE